jgi:hypothetical protein
MKSEPCESGNATTSHQPLIQRILGWPTTRLGWWSIGLGALFMVFLIGNVGILRTFTAVLPLQLVRTSFLLMLLFGLAAVILCLIAFIKCRERSWLIWLMILPALLVLLSFLLESFTQIRFLGI